MAQYQYRINSSINFQTNNGNGIIVIYNNPNSGKKIILNNFECINNTIRSTATVSTGLSFQLVKHSTTNGGKSISSSLTPMDSSNYLPSTVNMIYETEMNGTLDVLKVIDTSKTLTSLIAIRPFSIKTPFGKISNSISGIKSSSLVENISVRSNESVSLVPRILSTSTVNFTHPVRVDVELNVNNKTYVTNFITSPKPGQAIFSITNQSGSANNVILNKVSVSEFGTADTPYFRIVPVGQIKQNETIVNGKINTNILPMDSSYPAYSNYFTVYSDIELLPFGVPEMYLSEFSAGTPKGYNYLHVKDFNGPTYRSFFPEQCIHGVGIGGHLGGYIGFSATDLNVVKSNLTINPGEAIALVSSYETGVTSAYGLAAEFGFTFNIQVTATNAYTPYLNLTNLQNGSEVRIYNAGTQDELTGAENVTGGTFSWQYDYSVYTAVDIVIHHLNYVYYKIENQNLPATSDGITIVVNQQLDRYYSNP